MEQSRQAASTSMFSMIQLFSGQRPATCPDIRRLPPSIASPKLPRNELGRAIVAVESSSLPLGPSGLYVHYI